MPTLEAARVKIPNEIWQRGPRAVNAEIARLITFSKEKRCRRRVTDGKPQHTRCSPMSPLFWNGWSLLQAH